MTRFNYIVHITAYSYPNPREKEEEKNKQTNKQINKQASKHTNTQTNKHFNKQISCPTNNQKNKQTNRIEALTMTLDFLRVVLGELKKPGHFHYTSKMCKY